MVAVSTVHRFSTLTCLFSINKSWGNLYTKRSHAKSLHITPPRYIVGFSKITPKNAIHCVDQVTSNPASFVEIEGPTVPLSSNNRYIRCTVLLHSRLFFRDFHDFLVDNAPSKVVWIRCLPGSADIERQKYTTTSICVYQNLRGLVFRLFSLSDSRPQTIVQQAPNTHGEKTLVARLNTNTVHSNSYIASVLLETY